MMCNCDSKRLLSEYEIKCERLLFKLKQYETELSDLKSIDEQTRNNERQTIQSLNDQLDNLLYCSMTTTTTTNTVQKSTLQIIK